jgi:hypothetical protein
MCASLARAPTREIIFWAIKNYFCQLKFKLGFGLSFLSTRYFI